MQPCSASIWQDGVPRRWPQCSARTYSEGDIQTGDAAAAFSSVHLRCWSAWKRVLAPNAGAQASGNGSHGADRSSTVCEAVGEIEQERHHRRGGDHGRGDQADEVLKETLQNRVAPVGWGIAASVDRQGLTGCQARKGRSLYCGASAKRMVPCLSSGCARP